MRGPSIAKALSAHAKSWMLFSGLCLVFYCSTALATPLKEQSKRSPSPSVTLTETILLDQAGNLEQVIVLGNKNTSTVTHPSSPKKKNPITLTIEIPLTEQNEYDASLSLQESIPHEYQSVPWIFYGYPESQNIQIIPITDLQRQPQPSLVYDDISFLFPKTNISKRGSLTPAYHEIASQVLFNHTQEITLVLQDSQNHLLISQDNLEKWNVIIPNPIKPITYHDKLYYPLSQFKTISVQQGIKKNHIMIIDLRKCPQKISSTKTRPYTELAENVWVNHINQNQLTILLEDLDGNLFINQKDLNTWRILIPKNALPIHYQGESYYPLHTFKEASYVQDERNTAIDLKIPARYLKNQVLETVDYQPIHPFTPSTGGYLNYDVLAQKTEKDSSAHALLTPVIFTPKGSVISGFSFQRGSSHTYSPKNGSVRLNTTWETDYPEKMCRLRVGDSYSTPGSWGRSINLGGVQWGSDFSTQPNFVTYPLPSTHGESVVPSTVDLYANNLLLSKKDINAGPFAINNIPVISGAGTLSIVTTDIVGRQQVVNVPYYSSPTLLKPGLHDYQYEMGLVRNNFGYRSNDYGRLIFTGTDRKGITDHLTRELHTELSKQEQAIGLGGHYLLSQLGVFNLSAAGSHSDIGAGGLLHLGFERQAQNINFGFNTQMTTPNFMQASYNKNNLPPRMINQYFLGIPLGHSSLGIALTQQLNRHTSDTNLLNVTYQSTFFKDWPFFITAYESFTGQKDKAIYFSIFKNLSDRTSMNVSLTGQRNNNEGTIQLTRQLPSDTGLGYHLQVTKGKDTNYQASLYAQNSFGLYQLSAAHQNKETGYRAEAAGGLAILDGLFPTRTIHNGFAVVQVPDYPNIGIYSHNQVVTKTNSKGQALITDLLPYQNNIIKIEAKDFPLDAELGPTELNIMPYRNSGEKLRFSAHSAHGATLKLIQPKGKIVPVGATVTLKGKKGFFIVGHEGITYLTDLKNGVNKLTAHWDGIKCTGFVNYIHTKDPLPDLGVVRCLK